MIRPRVKYPHLSQTCNKPHTAPEPKSRPEENRDQHVRVNTRGLLGTRQSQSKLIQRTPGVSTHTVKFPRTPGSLVEGLSEILLQDWISNSSHSGVDGLSYGCGEKGEYF